MAPSKRTHDLLNEARTLQKNMRRDFRKLVELGLIEPNSAANNFFLLYDHELVDSITALVIQEGTTVQLELIDRKEEKPISFSS